MPGAPDELYQEIADQIANGTCTPIISNRLMMDYLFGRDKLADAWAEKVKYPVKETRHSMAQISQYASVHSQYTSSLAMKKRRLRAQQAKKLYHDFLIDTILDKATKEDKTTPDRASKIGEQAKLASTDKKSRTFTHVVEEALQYRPGPPADPDCACPTAPHEILAGLNVPVYVTTSHHTFLERALEQCRNLPEDCHFEAYAWKPEISDALERFKVDADFKPDNMHPLVYHLFGIDEEPESMVMSVDDHLDFVVNMTSDFRQGDSDRNTVPTMPRAVKRALRGDYLVLLGFSMDGWDLRALLKSLFGGSADGMQDERLGGVAIQFDPGNNGDQFSDADSYRKYLEETFADISLVTVIGEPIPFLTGLWKRIHPQAGGA